MITGSQEQKYITFTIGDEEYGIPVLEIHEIVRLENIIQVPNAVHYLVGMMDVRGTVIPILDLRKKLGIEGISSDVERAILFSVGKRKIGLAVEKVAHVMNFGPDQIDEGPPVLRNQSHRHITGVAKVQDRFIVLITLENLFAPDEVENFFAD